MIIRLLLLVVVIAASVLGAWILGFLGLVAANGRTPNPWICAISGLLTVFIVAGAGAAVTARVLGIRSWVRIGLITACFAAGTPLAFASTVSVVDYYGTRLPAVDDSVLAALAEHTYPLRSVDARSGFADLQPFVAAIGDRRVVALGEATHGTSEFFRMKHRLIELLVHELGFRHFAMETHWEYVAPILNDYVQGGDSNPESVLYWPWATSEYLELLAWMRGFNEGREEADRIFFHGIDPMEGARDSIMAVNVANLVKEQETHRVIVWAANSHVRGASNSMGQYLKELLRDDVYLLGLEFHSGAFTSRLKHVQTYEVGPFPTDYYTHALAQLPGELRFLDFTMMSQDPELKEWLNEPRVTNHLFESYALTRYFRSATRVRTPWLDLFDGIVFIERSTPSDVLSRWL